MPVTIEKITESPPLPLGEGPHWDEETQTLYFVDLFGGSIHKYKPSTKEYAKAKIGETVSFVIPVEGAKNKFVVSVKNELKVVTWDGTSDKVQSIEKLGAVDVIRDGTLYIFNDGKADRVGRLWLGTNGFKATKGEEVDFSGLSSKAGSLYTFGQDKKFKKQLDGITISNGLAFNDKLNKFYYIDSKENKIFQFDYDAINGTISNQETVFTLEKHNIEGMPDGQTIDADGNLWVAIVHNGKVIKIDPRKPETLLQTIEFPTKDVTSVAFGGANLDELYVTTGHILTDNKTDDDGRTFVVKGLGVRGLKAYKVKI